MVNYSPAAGRESQTGVWAKFTEYRSLSPLRLDARARVDYGHCMTRPARL